MPNSLFVPTLIAGMIITGSSNSLWSKWQDMQCVENCQDPNPRNQVLYEQPVWQTLQMFLGEMLCFLPVIYAALRARSSPAIQLPTASEDESDDDSNPKLKQQQLSGYKILLLWLPAACDLTGTTLMNVGLLYTPVSIYQMTRGALVLFVGILSVIFLHRRLWLYQWISLVTVMAGISVVGLSGSMIKDVVKEDFLGLFRQFQSPLSSFGSAVGLPPPEPIEQPQATKVLVGIFFVLFAQIFTATQFVIEEKIMSRYSVAPLVAVGYEGLFGAISILLFMPILAQFADRSPFFDLPRGWHQMIDNKPVFYSGIAIACSISLFNYFGLSVTRHVSATSRSLTDTCRTLSIWIISLALGWEKLLFPISLLQVLGFSLLVYGTFLFNNLVKPPKFLRPATLSAANGADAATGGPSQVDEERALLAEESLEETAALPADLGTSGFDVVPPKLLHHHHHQHEHEQEGQPTHRRTATYADALKQTQGD